MWATRQKQEQMLFGRQQNMFNDSNERRDNGAGMSAAPNMSFRTLGREFNPQKFDFGSNFNAAKFEMVEMGHAQQHAQQGFEDYDLMDLLPIDMLVRPELMASPYQQDGAVDDQRMMHDSHLMMTKPVPRIDESTLSLIDSLEMKYAPSSTTTTTQSPRVVEPVDMDVINIERILRDSQQDSCRPKVKVEADDYNFEGGAKGSTNEELKVLRNKAVQRRYRIRKKSEAMRQQDVYGNTQERLSEAERKAPKLHIQVVDKHLLLRRLNKDRDAEIKRLKKLLTESKAATSKPPGNVMIVGGSKLKAAYGDFCDDRVEVVVPHKIAVDMAGETCVDKIALAGIQNAAVRRIIATRFRSTCSPKLSSIANLNA